MNLSTEKLQQQQHLLDEIYETLGYIHQSSDYSITVNKKSLILSVRIKRTVYSEIFTLSYNKPKHIRSPKPFLNKIGQIRADYITDLMLELVEKSTAE